MKGFRARQKALLSLGFESYSQYLKSELWREIRCKVFVRDGKRCRICSDNATVVHHIDYSKQALSGERLSGLFALCKLCHDDIHRTERKYKRMKLLTLERVKCGLGGLPSVEQRTSQPPVCADCGKLRKHKAVFCKPCLRKKSAELAARHGIE